MGMFDHLYTDSNRTYEDYICSYDIFAVCWHSELLDIVNSGFSKTVDGTDKDIYRIKAGSKYEAVRKFLVQKYVDIYDVKNMPECKIACIKEIVESTIKNGRMKCLKSDQVLDDLSYDIETVIEGKYYSIDKDDCKDENQAMVEAIMKNVDYCEALEHLTYRVIVDVFVEAHLYDVAVIALSHTIFGPGYASLSGMR